MATFPERTFVIEALTTSVDSRHTRSIKSAAWADSVCSSAALETNRSMLASRSAGSNRSRRVSGAVSSRDIAVIVLA